MFKFLLSFIFIFSNCILVQTLDKQSPDLNSNNAKIGLLIQINSESKLSGTDIKDIQNQIKVQFQEIFKNHPNYQLLDVEFYQNRPTESKKMNVLVLNIKSAENKVNTFFKVISLLSLMTIPAYDIIYPIYDLNYYDNSGEQKQLKTIPKEELPSQFILIHWFTLPFLFFNNYDASYHTSISILNHKQTKSELATIINNGVIVYDTKSIQNETQEKILPKPKPIKLISTLGGFQINQKLSLAVKVLGKPLDVQVFNDGFKSYFFKFTSYGLILQTAPSNPDQIFSIQLIGKSNPSNYGIGKINLGDSLEKLQDEFGVSDSIKKAEDESSKKIVKNTFYHSYYTFSNFSVEVVDDIVFSIKLTIPNIPRKQSLLEADIDKLFKLIQEKNILELANSLDQDFQLKRNDKFTQLNGSVIKTLSGKNEISRFFFEDNDGLSTLTKANFIDGKMRMFESGKTAQVYLFKTNKGSKIELLFSANEFGYQLWEVNYFK